MKKKADENQLRAAAALHRMSDAVLNGALHLAAFEQHDNDDGTFFVPVIVMHAISADQSLLCSVVHFHAEHDPHEVAKLLRMAADHIDGKGPNGHLVERGFYQ